MSFPVPYHATIIPKPFPTFNSQFATDLIRKETQSDINLGCHNVAFNLPQIRHIYKSLLTLPHTYIKYQHVVGSVEISLEYCRRRGRGEGKMFAGDKGLTFTFPMLRLLSYKAQGRKYFRKPSKPCHVGIHWIALDEHSEMSTHLPGFQLFFRIFASFCIGHISHQHED